MTDYRYTPHPYHQARVVGKVSPPKVADVRKPGFNGRVGLLITRLVGTMWTAYLFAVLSLVSLPAVLRTEDPIIIVAWVSQAFLQLVLLPIIIVGQNQLGAAGDARAEATYKDVEAVLAEVRELQVHLLVQDEMLAQLASGKPGWPEKYRLTSAQWLKKVRRFRRG